MARSPPPAPVALASYSCRIPPLARRPGVPARTAPIAEGRAARNGPSTRARAARQQAFCSDRWPRPCQRRDAVDARAAVTSLPAGLPGVPMAGRHRTQPRARGIRARTWCTVVWRRDWTILRSMDHDPATDGANGTGTIAAGRPGGPPRRLRCEAVNAGAGTGRRCVERDRFPLRVHMSRADHRIEMHGRRVNMWPILSRFGISGKPGTSQYPERLCA